MIRKLRRQLGRKVLEMGGNSVLGYHQEFDVEGESGIVARGYGTACLLKKVIMSSYHQVLAVLLWLLSSLLSGQ